MKTGFESMHPMLQAVFFASCISVTMFIMHPIFIITSFVISSLYILLSMGIKKMFSALRLNIVTSLMIIIINPLISHGGVTVLCYLPDGNPLTAESVFFGCAAALLMSCTINWFYCLSSVLTSDKIIYLVGRAAPVLALIISMTLSFCSRLLLLYREISVAQKQLYTEKNSLFSKLRIRMNMLSSLISRSLENAVDTADSMKSRGYGTGKRSFCHYYRLRLTDFVLIVMIVSADIIAAAAYLSETIYFSYYPITELSFDSNISYFIFLVYAALCALPVVIDIREAVKWKYLRSAP